jgi:hypothetical protein
MKRHSADLRYTGSTGMVPHCSGCALLEVCMQKSSFVRQGAMLHDWWALHALQLGGGTCCSSILCLQQLRGLVCFQARRRPGSVCIPNNHMACGSGQGWYTVIATIIFANGFIVEGKFVEFSNIREGCETNISVISRAACVFRKPLSDPRISCLRLVLCLLECSSDI